MTLALKRGGSHHKVSEYWQHKRFTSTYIATYTGVVHHSILYYKEYVLHTTELQSRVFLEKHKNVFL